MGLHWSIRHTLVYDDDSGNAVAVDAAGSAYVAGYGLLANFPLFNPQQAVNGGIQDVFITKLMQMGCAGLFNVSWW